MWAENLGDNDASTQGEREKCMSSSYCTVDNLRVKVGNCGWRSGPTATDCRELNPDWQRYGGDKLVKTTGSNKQSRRGISLIHENIPPSPEDFPSHKWLFFSCWVGDPARVTLTWGKSLTLAVSQSTISLTYICNHLTDGEAWQEEG